jgi:hypothetical protein
MFKHSFLLNVSIHVDVCAYDQSVVNVHMLSLLYAPYNIPELALVTLSLNTQCSGSPMLWVSLSTTSIAHTNVAFKYIQSILWLHSFSLSCKHAFYMIALYALMHDVFSGKIILTHHSAIRLFARINMMYMIVLQLMSTKSDLVYLSRCAFAICAILSAKYVVALIFDDMP